jgi:hypothetical protein
VITGIGARSCISSSGLGEEGRETMKEDNDHPKVVYLHKYRMRRRKLNWPCGTGRHPRNSKTVWIPIKKEEAQESEDNEDR